MKKSNKKFIIILIVFIVLLITILSIMFFYMSKNRLDSVSLGKKEETVNKNITFTVYKYNSGSGSLFIKYMDNDNGIESIEMPKENIIYANGKNVVSVDYDFELGDTIEASMKTMTGEIVTQTLTIDETYINNLLNMMNSTPDEPEYQIMVVNSNIDESITSNKYYRLGNNNNTWVEFKDKFLIHDYDVVRKNLINDDDTITVYVKSEDKAGNAIVISDKVAINRNATLAATPIFDVYGLEKIDSNSSGSYILVADIDLSGKNYNQAIINNTFRGTLDGNGHKITNYTVNTGGNAGLIRCGKSCTIKNLKIENANISGSSAAGLMGWVEGPSVTINNCAVVKSTLYGKGYNSGVAGLVVVGNQYATIYLNNCYSYENTMSASLNTNLTGGILHNIAQHYNYTYANQCYFSGNLGTSANTRYMIGAQRVDLNLTSVYYDSTINTNATVAQGTALNTFGDMTELPAGFDSNTWILIDDDKDGKYDRPELKIFMPSNYLSKLKEKIELMIADYREQREIDGKTLQEYLTENNIEYDVYDLDVEIEENGYIFKINSMTLEIDEPIEISKKAKITLSKELIATGENFTVTFAFGKDIDIANCKYKLEKTNVTVEKDDVTTLIPENQISDIQLNESGEYYFYLLVAYKDGTESTLKKVKLEVVMKPTAITLNETNLDLLVGQNNQLTATVKPDGINQEVIWSTDNENVAAINDSGVVTAIGIGTATITVKSTLDNIIAATCTVTVTQGAESISLDNTVLQIDNGKNQTVIATVLPNNTNDKSVTWSSDNESVATVNQDGKITAVAPGTVTITVKTNDGSNKEATCSVSIVDVWEKYQIASIYNYRKTNTSELYIANFSRKGYYVNFGTNVTHAGNSNNGRHTITSERQINNGFDPSTGLWTASSATTDYSSTKTGYDYIGAVMFSSSNNTTRTSSKIMFVHTYHYVGTLYYDTYESYKTSSYEKGEYIEDVRSTNANAFPTNNYQENNGEVYWYIKK